MEMVLLLSRERICLWANDRIFLHRKRSSVIHQEMLGVKETPTRLRLLESLKGWGDGENTQDI